MDDDSQKMLCFLSYVLMLISGLLIYVMYSPEDPRVKFHAFQACVLGAMGGVLLVVFSIVRFPQLGALLLFLFWAYGMYVGFEAYCGHDAKIPNVSSFVTRHTGYKPVQND